MNQFGLSISYEKLIQIENDISRSVKRIEDETGGFAAPQWLCDDKFLSFAVDNVDFNEATFSGKNSFHGTALCVFQDKLFNDNNHQSMKFTRTNLKASNILPYSLIHCDEPIPRANSFPVDLTSLKSSTYFEKVDHTRLWMTSFFDMKVDNESKVLTWSGFNSRCTNKNNPIKNVGLVAPLLRNPPTQYEALLTSLIRADKINVHHNGPGCITVIGLDLQLYDMDHRR